MPPRKSEETPVTPPAPVAPPTPPAEAPVFNAETTAIAAQVIPAGTPVPRFTHY